MKDKTFLQHRELSDEEKSLVRSLYYENRLLLKDVADLLSPIEATRVYELKNSIDDPSSIPEPSEIGSIPSDEEFYKDEIPDEVMEDVDGLEPESVEE